MYIFSPLSSSHSRVGGSVAYRSSKEGIIRDAIIPAGRKVFHFLPECRHFPFPTTNYWISIYRISWMKSGFFLQHSQILRERLLFVGCLFDAVEILWTEALPFFPTELTWQGSSFLGQELFYMLPEICWALFCIAGVLFCMYSALV